MNRKRLLALASAFVTLSGAVSLTQPARASEAASAAVFGCTLEQYSDEITYAHESCRARGFDGGRVTYCDGKYMEYECFNIIAD